MLGWYVAAYGYFMFISLISMIKRPNFYVFITNYVIARFHLNFPPLLVVGRDI